MSVTVKIMNWNIQNYGPKKSGLDDIVDAIARIVVDEQIDILVQLELNTTKDATAETVAGRMQKNLNEYAKKKKTGDEYAVLLSPNTGTEYYAFFIRDTAKTAYAPVTGPAGQDLTVLGSGVKVTDAVFTAQVTKAGVATSKAPLLVPDRAAPNHHHVSTWPGIRKPVLGLFYVPGASAANRWLPIFACHFGADPNGARQTQQVAVLPDFSLLRGLSAGETPVALQVVLPGSTVPQSYTTNYYVVLGDFNLDYLKDNKPYTPLFGAGAPALGTSAALIGQNTHLVTPKGFSERVFHDTAALAIACYDNFFLRVKPGTTANVTSTRRSTSADRSTSFCNCPRRPGKRRR